MKRFLIVTLAILMLVSCTGCGIIKPNVVTDRGDFSGTPVTDVVSKEESDEPSVNKTAKKQTTVVEIRDIKDIPAWQNYLTRADVQAFITERALHADNVVQVKVHDVDKNPCPNVKVELLDGRRQTLYSGFTNINGDAFIVNGLDGTTVATHVRVGEKVVAISHGAYVRMTIDTPIKTEQKLDLMIMMDATGSMKDELAYLQREFKPMVEQIAGSSGDWSINLSVNFYKDVNDDFLVRSLPFTSDIDECIARLASMEADGGEDYYEAVDVALDDAINGHAWRTDATKMCFFIGDAPAHITEEANTLICNSLQSASAQGIHVIPIASLEADKTTEIMFRHFAVATGGTFLRIKTNEEPATENDEIDMSGETLKDAMVRIIKEYCNIK